MVDRDHAACQIERAAATCAAMVARETLVILKRDLEIIWKRQRDPMDAFMRHVKQIRFKQPSRTYAESMAPRGFPVSRSPPVLTHSVGRRASA